MDHIKEKKLSQDFCQNEVSKVRDLIEKSTTFTVVGMPGIGISIFLRYLLTRPLGRMIHVDVHQLAELKRDSLFELLLKELGGKSTDKNSDLLKLCSKQLEKLARENSRVIVVFNRFDQFKGEFDESFFGNLRSLRDIDKEKIVFIFAANQPLVNQMPEAFMGGNLYMYSTNLYLPPFSKKDLLDLLNINSNLHIQNRVLDKMITLCGGHYQLLRLLLNSEYNPNFLQDPIINLQLKALFDNLSYQQRKQLQQIVSGKKVSPLDPQLVKLGYINSRSEIFTPLFSRYILENTPFRFSGKEAKLFKLLKSRLGKIVKKDEIFEKVWENEDEATDWALDALIYRLRKNSLFSSRYILESHKRQGYSLLEV